MVTRAPSVVAVLMVVFSTASAVGSVHPLEYHPHKDDAPTHRKAAIGEVRPFSEQLRKCRCEGNQIWDGSRCEPWPTLVVVLDPETGLTSVVSTSQLGDVTIGEPPCPQGHSLAVLDSNRDSDDEFCLLASGTLYWQEVEYTDYCIDHTLDVNGEPRSWEAHVCLPPPQIPHCCAQDGSLADGDCTDLANRTFSPPVEVDGIPVEWEQSGGEAVRISCKEPEEMLRLRLGTAAARLVHRSGNVSLVWWSSDLQEIEQQKNYCVAGEAGTKGYVVKLCYEVISDATYVRKCCPEAQLIEGAYCALTKNESEMWAPSFYEADGLTPSSSPPEDLKIVHGFPLCQTFFPLDPEQYESDEFFLMTDGTLHSSSLPAPLASHRYCLDSFRSGGGAVDTQALVCFPEGPAEPQCLVVARNYLYPSLLLVSCVFLGLTLALYAGYPELRHKLHGKCLLALVSMLQLGYLTLAVTRLAMGKIPQGFCRFMASLMHWSFLAAFFWLNVMCFDIWRTISVMRTVSRDGRKATKRFRLYSLYSWGCSFLITIVAIIIEELPDRFHIVRPNFSDKTCWFQNTLSLWAYLYGFILVLVLTNIVFFGMVACILIQSQNDHILQLSRSQSRERLWLCLKLFLVMGVTWVAEVISWQEGSCQAWIILDIINSLQGFSIFLVFVCKKTNLNKVQGSCSSCCGWNKLQATLSSSITVITGLSTSKSSARHSSSSNASLNRGSLRQQGPPATSLAFQPCSQVVIPLGTIMETSQSSAEHNHREDQPGSHSDSDDEMPLGNQRETSCDITSVMLSHNPSSEAGVSEGVLHIPKSGAELTTEATPLRMNESTSPTTEEIFLSASEKSI